MSARRRIPAKAWDALAHSTDIVAEYHTPDPMDTILDGPMTTDRVKGEVVAAHLAAASLVQASAALRTALSDQGEVKHK